MFREKCTSSSNLFRPSINLSVEGILFCRVVCKKKRVNLLHLTEYYVLETDRIKNKIFVEIKIRLRMMIYNKNRLNSYWHKLTRHLILPSEYLTRWTKCLRKYRLGFELWQAEMTLSQPLWIFPCVKASLRSSVHDITIKIIYNVDTFLNIVGGHK